jgi:hypothetical protein
MVSSLMFDGCIPAKLWVKIKPLQTVQIGPLNSDLAKPREATLLIPIKYKLGDIFTFAIFI